MLRRCISTIEQRIHVGKAIANIIKALLMIWPLLACRFCLLVHFLDIGLYRYLCQLDL